MGAETRAPGRQGPDPGATRERVLTLQDRSVQTERRPLPGGRAFLINGTEVTGAVGRRKGAGSCGVRGARGVCAEDRGSEGAEPGPGEATLAKRAPGVSGRRTTRAKAGTRSLKPSRWTIPCILKGSLPARTPVTVAHGGVSLPSTHAQDALPTSVCRHSLPGPPPTFSLGDRDTGERVVFSLLISREGWKNAITINENGDK